MKYSNSSPSAAPVSAITPQNRNSGMGEVTSEVGMSAKMALTLVRTFDCRNQRSAMYPLSNVVSTQAQRNTQ